MKPYGQIPNKPIFHPHSPWLFFALAFGISWLFWVPATFVKANIMESAWVITLYTGGLGPPLAGLWLTYRVQDRAYQKEYWQRVLDPSRIRAGWYFVILAAYPFVVMFISLLSRGGIVASQTLTELLDQPGRILPFLLFIFIFGPFPEELGWRGYALDALQRDRSAVRASLILGAFWALWHLPLFFINGTYQNELGFGTLAFWQFCLFAVVFSIFITWVYNNNRRSVLSATLFHFAVNLTGNLFEISPAEELLRNGLLLVLAFVVVRVYGAGTLRHPQEQASVQRA